jgi:four helix bundle protein
MEIRSYRDLEIYRLSFQYATELHDLSMKFPKFETFEEGSQLRKSSKSIAATITEGWGRRYYKSEFVKFLIYALASCDETSVHLDFVHKSGYMDVVAHREFIKKYEDLGKKINRFLQKVRQDHLRPQEKPARDLKSEIPIGE